MEYEELYDESPFSSKEEDSFASREVPRRGGKMNNIRAAFMVCVTILASVFGVLFYDFTQDQYVVSSGSNFVAIFDRKSKEVNVCSPGGCHKMKPHFEEGPSFMERAGISRARHASHKHQGGQAQPGSRHLGSFQPQQQTPQVTPQMLQQIQQRRAIEDQQLANNQLTPQMIQQIRQRRAQEDQLIAQARGQQAASQQQMAPQQQQMAPQQQQMAPQQQMMQQGQPQYRGGMTRPVRPVSAIVVSPDDTQGVDEPEEEPAPV